MVARGVSGWVAGAASVVVTCGKTGAGFGVGAVMGLGSTGSRCGKSCGLGRFRSTTNVLLALGDCGVSADEKTHPMAHAKTAACKPSDRTKAKKEGLQGMKGRGAGLDQKRRGLRGLDILASADVTPKEC